MPGYSDPLDEQTFIVNTINAMEQSSFWSSTAIIIAYDDSDGWYDHLTDLVNGSATTQDSLNGRGDLHQCWRCRRRRCRDRTPMESRCRDVADMGRGCRCW